MGPEKSRLLILTLFPYRETSYIIHAVTPSHGKISAIAKGIRRNKKGISFLERGFLIECLLYIQPHRTLHTLGAIQVLDFHQSVRSSLLKSAVRDTAYELTLAAIKDTEQHAGLYDLLAGFTDACDTFPEMQCYPELLWLFLLDFAELAGFLVDVNRCISCGRPLAPVEDGFLSIRRGGIECPGCCHEKKPMEKLTGAMRQRLAKGPAVADQSLTTTESFAITRLLADWCRYHCDARSQLQALDFLFGLTAGAQPAA
jgi:DNA repair protein RecO